MTRTQRILERDDWRCQYCGGQAQHADHIVSRADRQRYPGYEGDEYIAAACREDNWRKLDSRLVPPSRPELVSELNQRMTGTRWRVYAGGSVTHETRRGGR